MSVIRDLLIVGGGIQGACLARDAAGRGLDVLLCEKGDLASATSSATSKLVHGGLRYLEHGAFRLVRESLAEREVLLASAPHLVRPLRFVLPHTPWSRGRWALRLGLFLYDRLGGSRTLEGSRSVRLSRSPWGNELRAEFERGFAYSDCLTDDARLVVLNARAAADLGADIRTRTEVLDARRVDGIWRATLLQRTSDGAEGASVEVAARALVNAAGPWAGRVLDEVVPNGRNGRPRLRLVQGTHIVVPRLLDGDHALTLQHEDGRVVFVIPFGDCHTMIGTTELPLDEDPGRARPTSGEVNYLCATASRFLREPVKPADVVWSFAGVRPLYDDGRDDPSAVSRDDVLELEEADGWAPLLTIIGGKLTTARRVAERALDALAQWFPHAETSWTASAPLPGGTTDPDHVLDELARRAPDIHSGTLRALVQRHGDVASHIVGEGGELGPELAPGLHEREVVHLVEQEWAATADDVLWRRTKVGLAADATQRVAVAACVAAALDRLRRAESVRGAGLESR